MVRGPCEFDPTFTTLLPTTEDWEFLLFRGATGPLTGQPVGTDRLPSLNP
jgi:hypothetical protein